jgi:hypothetical protein
LLRRIAWKQDALGWGKYEYTGLKPERLKHVIADDLALLAAHPVRQIKPPIGKGQRSSAGADHAGHSQ